MIYITNLVLLVLALLTTKFCITIVQTNEYRKKERQLAQLRQICTYLLEREKNPEEAYKLLGKEIKVHGKWLYTKYFFFNLDGNALKKAEKYLLELMEFFISRTTKKNVLNSIVELKTLLNRVA